ARPYGLSSGFVWSWITVRATVSAAIVTYAAEVTRDVNSRARSGAASTAGTRKKRIRNGFQKVSSDISVRKSGKARASPSCLESARLLATAQSVRAPASASETMPTGPKAEKSSFEMWV